VNSQNALPYYKIDKIHIICYNIYMTDHWNRLPSKDELQKLLENHTKQEIASMLGISIHDLNGILKKNKLIPTKTPNIVEKLADYLASYSHEQVAKLLKVNIRTLYYYVKKYNLIENKNYKVKGIKDRTNKEYWYYIIEGDQVNKVNKNKIKKIKLLDSDNDTFQF